MRPGLYLKLFHGFPTLEARQRTANWGEQGPMIGPLKYVHTTYATHIKFEFVDEEAGAPWKDCPDMHYITHGGDYTAGDLQVGAEGEPDVIELNGMRYGDWTVYYHDGKEN